MINRIPRKNKYLLHKPVAKNGGQGLASCETKVTIRWSDDGTTKSCPGEPWISLNLIWANYKSSSSWFIQQPNAGWPSTLLISGSEKMHHSTMCTGPGYLSSDESSPRSGEWCTIWQIVEVQFHGRLQFPGKIRTIIPLENKLVR